MKKHLMLACGSAILLLVAVGCTEQPDAVADAESPVADATADAAPATPSVEPQAKPAAPAQPAPAAPVKFVPPIRGQAEIGIIKPVTKREGKEIVTVIKVKNLSTTGSIAGLKLDEYWYDKAGNPVTGDTYRHRKPLMPEEVIEITLRTPVDPKMHQNQYNFSHANGPIKAKTFPKF
jgi:hypothetical protein